MGEFSGQTKINNFLIRFSGSSQRLQSFVANLLRVSVPFATLAKAQTCRIGGFPSHETHVAKSNRTISRTAYVAISQAACRAITLSTSADSRVSRLDASNDVAEADLVLSFIPSAVHCRSPIFAAARFWIATYFFGPAETWLGTTPSTAWKKEHETEGSARN